MAEVVLHLGAHGTDEGLIARWLSLNVGALRMQGVQPLSASQMLLALTDMLGEPASRDPSGHGSAPGGGPRLVASVPALLGPVQEVLSPEGFYQRGIGRRIERFGAMLPHDTGVTLCLAVGSAQRVLPALLSPGEGGGAAWPEARAVLPDHATLPWADLVTRLHAQAPRARLVVWRHEDLPRVWPQVLGHLTGDAENIPVDGAGEFTMLGLSTEARTRLRRYLAAKPPPSLRLMQRVVDAFGASYGLTEAGPPPLLQHLPEALQARLIALDEGYAEEVSRLAALEGVTLLG